MRDATLSDNVKKALSHLESRIGVEEPPGEWFLVDQSRISQFADVTEDHNFIHVDPERARAETPMKTTIAHGFLTLSLLSHLVQSIAPREKKPSDSAEVAISFNYGLNRVRFPTPLKVNSRIRVRRKISSVKPKPPNAVQTVQDITVEIEGESKPACVAEWIAHIVYK